MCKTSEMDVFATQQIIYRHQHLLHYANQRNAITGNAIASSPPLPLFVYMRQGKYYNTLDKRLAKASLKLNLYNDSYTLDRYTQASLSWR